MNALPSSLYPVIILRNVATIVFPVRFLRIPKPKRYSDLFKSGVTRHLLPVVCPDCFPQKNRWVAGIVHNPAVTAMLRPNGPLSESVLVLCR